MTNKDKFEQLCNELLSKAIVIPKDFVGTIKPEFLSTKITDGYEIHANANGPIDMDAYWKEKIRIVFVLKESYITKASFDNQFKPDRGKHKQCDLFDSGNRTYKNMGKIAYSIVHEIYTKNVSDKYLLTVLQNHVAIVNINYFPGIKQTKSNDSIISQWASINRDVLKKQIKYLDPCIIIGGNTLNLLYEHEQSFKGNTNGGYGHFLDYDVNVIPQCKLDVPTPGNKDIYYNDKILCLNLCHPSRSCIEKELNGIVSAVKLWEKNRQLFCYGKDRWINNSSELGF